jgi:PKD repeat protein
VDTLTQEEIGLIVVHPNPTADFSIDKDYTDICNSEIEFTNHSVGALYYHYNFDDVNGATSSEENPTYAYAGDGFHNPILVAENEFGCTDTARANLLRLIFRIRLLPTVTKTITSLRRFWYWKL